jgi:hypothetical protein
MLYKMHLDNPWTTDLLELALETRRQIYIYTVLPPAARKRSS